MLKKICALLILLPMLSAPQLAVQVGGAGGSEGMAYLKARQNKDGGFAEPGAGSDDRLTCWVIMAGAAAGENPSSYSKSGVGAVEYLTSKAGSVNDLENLEFFTLAMAESGADPRNVSGRNMVSLVGAYVGGDGMIGKNLREHCWGMISLAAAGEKVSAKSTGWLVSKQREDGGWGGTDEDVVYQTALSVEALVAVGETDPDIIGRAMKLLKERMNADGGFKGTAKQSDSMLTASVVRAVCAAGGDPASREWSFHGNSPTSFLSSMQTKDGYYRFAKGVESQPSMTTAMAVPAACGKHFPLGAKGAEMPEEQESGQVRPLHDLGTAGAAVKPANEAPKKAHTEKEKTQPGAKEVAKASSTGVIARRATWLNGFWLFVIICAVYAVVLLLAVALVAMILSPKRRSTYR